jgi:serine protease Do
MHRMTEFASPQHDPNEAQSRKSRLASLRSGRIALLSAAAAVALTAAYAGQEWPHASFLQSARAEQTQTTESLSKDLSAQAQAAQPFSFANIVDHVRGAVVSIKVKITEDVPGEAHEPPRLSPDDPLYRFFKRFGDEGMPERHLHPHVEQAQGSGFIISPDGYIVTNNHVVDHATEVNVVTDEGKILSAKVVGIDKKTDLALLKLTSGTNYPYVEFSSTPPRVGDWVLAVGNPFGLGGTVTAGIISARGRDIGSGPYDDFLQIDAPVNRGNSGGPTFGTDGKVVGVNTAIFSPSGGSVGIGFAIPSEVAQNVVKALKEKGIVTRGWIGVQIQPVNGDIADSLGLKAEKGALVADVQKNAPAAEAGIKSGDVILGVNGENVDGPRELARKIASLGPEAKADLMIWRDGEQQTISVKLGALPNEKEKEAKAESAETDRGSLNSFGLALAPAQSVPGAGKDGVVITDLDPDGVAAQKGLKIGDVILEAGGKAVSKPADIRQTLADAKKEGRKTMLMRVKTSDGTRFIALAIKPAS